MIRSERRILLAVLLGFLGAGLCPAQKRQEKKPEEKPKEKPKVVSVQVWAIRASTEDEEISPELKSIADDLKKKYHFKFKGFKLEKTLSCKVEVEKSCTQTLIGGYSIRVTPLEHDGKSVRMRIELLKDGQKKLNVTLRLSVGTKTIVGGGSLDKGDTLVTIVSAK